MSIIFDRTFVTLVVTLIISTFCWPLFHDSHYWLGIMGSEVERMEAFLSFIPFGVPDLRALTETFTGLTLIPNSYELSQIEISLIDAGKRVLDLEYFHAVGALFQTAWARIFLLSFLLIIFSPALIAAFWIGNQKRKNKYDNFEHSHPTVFRLLLTGKCLFLLLVLNLVVLPWMMPGWMVLTFVAGVAFFIGALTANFHLF